MTEYKENNGEQPQVTGSHEEPNSGGIPAVEIKAQPVVAEEGQPAVENFSAAEPEQHPLRVYDIIYGTLFEPVKTMKMIVQKPPVGTTVIIIVLLSLVELLTGLYTSTRGGPSNLGLDMGMPFRQAMEFSRALRAAAPVLAVLGVLFYFIKWFFYSALLHLLAEFFGGQGKARTVFTVYGLASLPTVFFIPLNVLAILLFPSVSTAVTTIAGLGVFIWGVILLTIGLREAHQMSTGRTLAVIFTPMVTALVLVVISVVGLMSVISSFIPTTW